MASTADVTEAEAMEEESTVTEKVDIVLANNGGLSEEEESDEEDKRHTRTALERTDSNKSPAKRDAYQDEVDKITAEVLQELEQQEQGTQETAAPEPTEKLNFDHLEKPSLNFLRNGLSGSLILKYVLILPFEQSLLKKESVLEYMKSASDVYMHTANAAGDFGWLNMAFGTYTEARYCKEQLEAELGDIVKHGSRNFLPNMVRMMARNQVLRNNNTERSPCILVGHTVLDKGDNSHAEQDDIRDEVGQFFPDAMSVFLGKRQDNIWCVAVEFSSRELAHEAVSNLDEESITLQGQQVKFDVYSEKWKSPDEADTPETPLKEVRPVLDLPARDEVVKKWSALRVSVNQLEAKTDKSDIEEKRLKLLDMEVKKLAKQLEVDDEQRSLRCLPAIQWKRGIFLSIKPIRNNQAWKRNRKDSTKGPPAKQARSNKQPSTTTTASTDNSTANSNTAAKKAATKGKKVQNKERQEGSSSKEQKTPQQKTPEAKKQQQKQRRQQQQQRQWQTSRQGREQQQRQGREQQRNRTGPVRREEQSTDRAASRDRRQRAEQHGGRGQDHRRRGADQAAVYNRPQQHQVAAAAQRGGRNIHVPPRNNIRVANQQRADEERQFMQQQRDKERMVKQEERRRFLVQQEERRIVEQREREERLFLEQQQHMEPPPQEDAVNMLMGLSQSLSHQIESLDSHLSQNQQTGGAAWNPDMGYDQLRVRVMQQQQPTASNVYKPFYNSPY